MVCRWVGGSWSAHGAWVGLSHRTEFRRTSDVQMQAQADDLLSLPDALPDGRYLSFACTAAPSPPPGPPSPASSVTDAAPDSLPPDPLACSLVVTAGQPLDQQAAAQNVRVMELGQVPLSWAEADREFYASAAGQANVAPSAAGPSGPSGPSTAPVCAASIAPPNKRPSGGGVQSTCGGQGGGGNGGGSSKGGGDSSKGRSGSGAPSVQSPRKKASTRRGEPRGERSSSWIRQLGQRWHALSDAEKAKHMRWNGHAPSPAPAGAGVDAATVAGAAIGVGAAIVVGAAAASTLAPAPPPAPTPALPPAPPPAPTPSPYVPAAAPFPGLAPYPTAAPLPAPFPAAAPGPAVDQIELAYRLAVSRMAEADRLAETAVRL